MNTPTRKTCLYTVRLAGTGAYIKGWGEHSPTLTPHEFDALRFAGAVAGLVAARVYACIGVKAHAQPLPPRFDIETPSQAAAL